MMEAAEHQMLRSLGITVLPPKDAEKRLSWPRVAASCDYLAAARFEDILTIDVAVTKLGESSVQYGFQFSRDGQPVARGAMTAVCCELLPEGGLKKASIPQELREKLLSVCESSS